MVQRQSGSDQELFRRELQSLGDGEFSKESWLRWRSRALELLPLKEQQDFFKTGILACALKKDMVKHNIMKVKDNHQPIAPITAVSTPKGACHESSERASGLISKIIISRNTVFRLTSNLWTKAGLTNGAVGRIHAIIYSENQQPPSLPAGIIATFDDYKGPPFLPNLEKSVPIVPVRRDWHANKIHCTRTMLPIILGYALSIHKLQGSTCERVILNPGKKEFANGLLLVGATRTKRFENLAFAPFPNYSRFLQVNKSKAIKKRKQEEERMQLQQLHTIQKYA
jgi:ATP-dependent exoDNAse (exonuclease V) alpha subunit